MVAHRERKMATDRSSVNYLFYFLLLLSSSLNKKFFLINGRRSIGLNYEKDERKGRGASDKSRYHDNK